MLYLGDESHARIWAHVHSGENCYGDKQPGWRAGRVHSFDQTVLLSRTNNHWLGAENNLLDRHWWTPSAWMECNCNYSQTALSYYPVILFYVIMSLESDRFLTCFHIFTSHAAAVTKWLDSLRVKQVCKLNCIYSLGECNNILTLTRLTLFFHDRTPDM